MDSIVFSRDYRQQNQAPTSQAKFDLLCAVSSKVGKMIDNIPKIVNPEGKRNYEYLLNACDQYAQNTFTRIEGCVDMQDHDATIRLKSRFFEFDCDDTKAFFIDITQRALLISFTVCEDEPGMMELLLLVDYFDDLYDVGEIDCILTDDLDRKQWADSDV